MQYLESFLSSTSEDDQAGFGGALEELQAVLLLAGFALLRPVAPGLWYIIGVAVRLAVDLGLHSEEGSVVEAVDIGHTKSSNISVQPGNQGQRQWTRDVRRRLWWCVYSFDRLVRYFNPVSLIINRNLTRVQPQRLCRPTVWDH